MIKEKLVEALVKSAMHFEEETHRFYLRCMEQERDPKIARLFARLAAEELRHKGRLESLLASDLESVLEIEEGDIPPVIDVPESAMRGAPKETEKAFEVLRMALDHEISSYNFYTLLGGRSALSVTKKTFQFLAAEEERHIEHIRAMMAELEG